MSPELISIAAKIFERLAPFYVLWDLGDEIEQISAPLRRYWRIPPEVEEGKIFLSRPFAGELQGSLFEELTGVMLTAHWGEGGKDPIRGAHPVG